VSSNGKDHEGKVVGYSVWRKFGKNPSEMEREYGMKFSGFVIKGDQIEFDLRNLGSEMRENRKYLHVDEMEEVTINALTTAWKEKGIAKTWWASEKQQSLRPWICDELHKLDYSKAFEYAKKKYTYCYQDVKINHRG